MFKSIEFDDCVLAGIGNGTRDIDQWQLQLPLEIRSRVVAIVEAPNWHELPQGSRIEMPATPNSNAALTLPSLSLGILTIAAILCGIIFGFIFQSAAIVYLCLTVAGFSIGTTIFLQSRAKGVAAALGINPSIEDAQSRGFYKTPDVHGRNFEKRGDGTRDHVVGSARLGAL